MQIISELEQTARGTYGGCVGYFSFNGNLDCCITIRTALIKDGRAYIQAGGGWVNDSTPDAEFDDACRFILQLRNGQIIAVESDRKTKARIGGKEFTLGAFTPLHLRD